VLPAGWEDPVATALNRLAGWQVPHVPAAWLDGRSYRVVTEAAEVALTLSFANPDEPCLSTLEQALLSAATHFVRGDAAAVLQDYIRRWATYAQTE
jgi:hypothetical protein